VQHNPELGPNDERFIDEKLAKEYGIWQWVTDKRETEDFIR
jgi:hypothetical protein